MRAAAICIRAITSYRTDATCDPVEWVNADVLITESTFADPQIIHPDPVEEIKKLNAIKSNILLGAYGLGKSQRLVRMINDYAPQKKVLIHHRIMPMNQIYEKSGLCVRQTPVVRTKTDENAG